jgi:hypothetical protein
VLPAFWLAQNRLWTWLATFGAALAFASPLGLAAVAVIWVLGGLYFRTSGPSLLRADRVMEGFHRRGIVAARSETEARAIWLALSPDSKFRFHTPEGPMQPAEA